MEADYGSFTQVKRVSVSCNDNNDNDDDNDNNDNLYIVHLMKAD